MGLDTLLVLRASNVLTFWNSFDLPVHFSLQGISNPPCGRSEEYLLPLVGVQTIAPPLAKNSEQIRDIFLGIWPTTVSSLSTATAYQSASFNGSLSHKISSPIDASHRFLYT